MKRYEGLFILNTAGKEESVKDVIDKVQADLVAAGATIETVQRMEKRPFARVRNRKYSAGYYVNFIFTAPETVLPSLRNRFALNEDVVRVMFTRAPAPKAQPAS